MLTLYHIHASPFAEKARWALDYKKLDWKSELLMPGRHADAVESVSGTRTVPVLVDSEAAEPITSASGRVTWDAASAESRTASAGTCSRT